jgi:hypothetical protein
MNCPHLLTRMMWESSPIEWQIMGNTAKLGNELHRLSTARVAALSWQFLCCVVVCCEEWPYIIWGCNLHSRVTPSGEYTAGQSA